MPSYKKHIRADKVGVGSEVVTPKGDEVTVARVRHLGPVVQLQDEDGRRWTETAGDTLWVWGKTTAYKKPPAGRAEKAARALLGGKKRGGRR